MQILETAVIVAWSFIAMPKDPKGKPALMQVTKHLLHYLLLLPPSVHPAPASVLLCACAFVSVGACAALAATIICCLLPVCSQSVILSRQGGGLQVGVLLLGPLGAFMISCITCMSTPSTVTIPSIVTSAEHRASQFVCVSDHPMAGGHDC